MGSFLLTVNPSSPYHSQHDARFLAAQARRTARGEMAKPSRWSTHRQRGYAAGDRVYLLAQGSGPRGLIGGGFVATGDVYTDDSWRNDGLVAHYVDVDWEAFVDLSDVLPIDELRRVAPVTHWRPQGSGIQIPQADESAVESAWTRHLRGLTVPPVSLEITRSYTNALRKVRRHQQRFRGLLLQYYPQECAHCGLDILELLEAAHIEPDSEGGAASVANGRLLCANHHRALDRGLLHWDEQGGRFVQTDEAVDIPPLPRH
ncbi:hypothetical protein G9U51_09430 [Calidifontibacter sp. DB0510]|uniref:HNH nuclease domain-containing protein n=1 Tax=Metallococcus carri TaxID=1656884 RepID=A0A967EEU1_9MICO|nr:HNH endonuclease [Metallococcus carri]NHN55996.1 hypothetical protein [Metallococcus carri]NOP37547.1 hypothetical protein [Calidifontibacter sp. DB2511S]